ncbi:MAG: ATP-binding protein [Liquorilactobacillus hordei]|uniref:ATP-binding protein n=1 Tax=Liquorilactobacillus hordei TaxID=468911 RepID=UPI0039E9AACF
MNVDKYYTDIDKENFYLGIISQVYRGNSCVQIENLSLLRNRKIRNEDLIPNTINYLVVIEDTQGLFIGEVFQAKVQDTDSVNQAINKGYVDRVFPEIGIDIVGYMDQEGYFKLPGFKNVGISDKVYVANSKLVDEYQRSLEVSSTLNSGQASLNNLAVFSNATDSNFSIQPNTLFDRHLLVIGSTNSGKSTSSLAILDRLLSNHKKLLVIDPTGEYRDSFPEATVKHLKLGEDTFLPVGAVTIAQWELLFQTNDNTQGAVLSDAIKSLRFNYANKHAEEIYVKDGKKTQLVQSDLATVTEQDTEFNLLKLPEQIIAESVELNTNRGHTEEYIFKTFRANANTWLAQKIEHQFEYSTLSKFFTDTQAHGYALLEEIDKFSNGQTESLYIDASSIGLSDGIGTMIIDLISNYIINKPSNEVKPFVLFVDEVHRYTQSFDEAMGAISGLINIAREGRKKGIFLFLTTQSPSDVPKILFSQVGTLLIHRLTSIEDLQVIRNHLDERSQKQIINLNRGEALLSSINLLKDIQLVFHKSGRVHHNETPLL